MMQVINKNEGPKIAYEENGTMVFLGDYEIMLNIAKYQRDWPVHIDVCSNRDSQLVIGTGEGLYYVAQFDIPAIQYEQPQEPVTEGQVVDPPAQISLDMADVTITLWGLDNQVPVEN